MTDIFLSYAEQDRARARQLAETLGAIGWDVWWDRRIPAGTRWPEVLEAQLKSMRCMVVLWSSRSVASDWVYEEASEGRRLRRLVPVLIEAVQPPVGFRELQAADLSGWDGSQQFAPLTELVHDIERLIGGPHLAAAAVVSPRLAEAARRTGERRWKALAVAGALILGAALAMLAARLSGEAKGPKQAQAPATQPAQAPAVGAPNANAPIATTEIRSLPRAAASQASQASQDRSADQTPAAIKARCERLKERLSVGESLSEESRSFYVKDCAR